jgi:polyribonucleotide nucleotidyltransferase
MISVRFILNTLKEAGNDEKLITYAIKSFERFLVREIIKRKGTRTGGRKHDEIRQIEVEVNILSRTHGSGLFTRGNTQALVVTALGTTHHLTQYIAHLAHHCHLDSS